MSLIDVVISGLQNDQTDGVGLLCINCKQLLIKDSTFRNMIGKEGGCVNIYETDENEGFLN